MNTLPPWERLKEVAERNRDACGQHLRDAASKRDAAKQKLETLVGYRRDYERRLAAMKNGGIGGDALRNYHAFLAQLERAIEQQSDLLVDAERDVHNATVLYAAERRRVRSSDLLDDRQAHTQRKAERRREQRQNDEWASRLRLSAGSGD
jgi:flagellar FliJ protein